MSGPPPGRSGEVGRHPQTRAPLNTRETRSSHFHELIDGRAVPYALVLGIAAALLGAAATRNVVIAIAGPLTVVVGVLAIAYWRASGQAEADFFEAYAAARGFVHYRNFQITPLTPLLGAGDRRHCEHYMEGPLGSAFGKTKCALSHFVFEVKRSPSSDGDDVYSHYANAKHHFTICLVDLEPGMLLFPGIYLCRRRGLLGKADRGNWLRARKLREVELESSEFAQLYELRVDQEQDDVRLRELFSPSLVIWLAQHPLGPCFEYRAGALVTYVERTLDDATHLDWLREATGEIARRISGELDEAVRAHGLGVT